MAESLADMVMSEVVIAQSKISFEGEKLPNDDQFTLESNQVELKVRPVGCSVFQRVSWSAVLNPYKQRKDSLIRLNVVGFPDDIKNKLNFQVTITAGGQVLTDTGCSINTTFAWFPNTVGKKSIYQEKISLDVQLKIKILQERRSSSRSDTVSNYSMPNIFSKLLDDTTLSDFTFNVKGIELKVHRDVLAVTSPVMHNLFTANFEENEENYSRVDHIEPDIFKFLLRFIYTGEVPENIRDSSMDLYSAAHYYEVADLKEICKNEIRASLSKENAVKICEWSQVYDKLKMELWESIKRDILEIDYPLVHEPLSPSEIKEIIEHKENEEQFWAKFKRCKVDS